MSCVYSFDFIRSSQRDRTWARSTLHRHHLEHYLYIKSEKKNNEMNFIKRVRVDKIMFVHLFCVLISILSVIVFYCIRKVNYYQNYFQQQGIPTPPLPSYLYGHFQMLWNAERFSEQLWNWTKQYGSIVGFVAGRQRHERLV